MRILDSCVVQQISNCQPSVSAIPAAYFLCLISITQDIRAALYCICRIIDCVLRHCLNAKTYIFAVVNCHDVALSVLYSPVSMCCRIFLQL